MDEYDHSEQNDESDVSDSLGVPNDTQHHSQRKPRGGNACLTCRRMKTRCEYFDDASPCKLCAKSNRECVKAPPRRKRRKTVTRIADLEQRIQNLTSALIDKSPVDSKSLPHNGADFQPAPNARTGQSAAKLEGCARPASITPDVIDKGIVDKATGFAAFHRYREQLDLYYGFVPLPRDLDVDKYRRQKPLLFSTLVLAGINSIRPDLVEPIAQDVVMLYVDRIHLRGERSLELVQSLLIYVCFHCRTLKREHLTFYQNISTALTMALDLGMGRRMGKNAKPRWIAEEDFMDARRAYLGCYYMAGQAAISMRHPIFIRWGPYIEECLEVISTTSQPARDDGWLVELIRLHRIAEDAHYTFSMDDPASTLSLKDPKTQYHLHALEERLEQWRRESKFDPSALRARLCAATVNLFIHEIALHSHQSIDSLRSPPDPEHLAAFFNDMDIGPARIDALCTCLASARAYLDSLLSLDIDTLRCLPNMYFVRSGYAAMTLKWLEEIDIETRSPGPNSGSTPDSGSSLGQRASLPSLEVNFDYYIDSMIQLFEEVGKDDKSNIAVAFSQTMKMIKAVKLNTIAGVPTIPLPITASTTTMPSIVPDTVSNNIPSTAPTTDQMPPPPYQEVGPYLDANSELEFDLPEFDTAMFDVSTLNFDPGFTTMGFWTLGGWSAQEGENNSGFMNANR